MGIFYGFLIVLEMVISALLIAVIFMQKTKGGMGGSAFGGGAGEAIFGSRMGNVLTKATVVLGIAFLANTLMLTVLTSRRTSTGSVMESVATQPAALPQQAAPGGRSAAPGWMETEMPSADVMPIEMPVESESVVTAEETLPDDVLVIPPAEEQEPVVSETAEEAAPVSE